MNARVAILSALVAGTIVLAMAQTAAYVWGEPMSTFTRDFQATTGVPWYTGAISVLNNMLWTGTALLSFLVAWLIPARRRRLATFGGFALALGVDDALQLHDVVGPDNGVPQEAFLAVYAVWVLVLSWAMLRDPNRGVAVAFVLGTALLAVSLGFDELFPRQHLIEDGAKLLGALTWLTLPMIACRRDLIEPGRT